MRARIISPFLEAEQFPGVIFELTLSERNLETMLAKVRNPDSAKMIYNADATVNGEKLPNGRNIVLQLRAEPDDVHYAERAAGLVAEDLS